MKLNLILNPGDNFFTALHEGSKFYNLVLHLVCDQILLIYFILIQILLSGNDYKKSIQCIPLSA